ncbi:MAG: hypothetical protein ABIA47_01770 [bacterium]
MKKIVIAGSISFQDHYNMWIDYWQDRGFEVIDYPVRINSQTFKQDYPGVFRRFFDNIQKADILFVFNEDKNGIGGYIGAESFAEMAFAVHQKLSGKDINIILFKQPSEQVQSFDEVSLWIELGWATILERNEG